MAIKVKIEFTPEALEKLKWFDSDEGRRYMSMVKIKPYMSAMTLKWAMKPELDYLLEIAKYN